MIEGACIQKEACTINAAIKNEVIYKNVKIEFLSRKRKYNIKFYLNNKAAIINLCNTILEH